MFRKLAIGGLVAIALAGAAGCATPRINRTVHNAAAVSATPARKPPCVGNVVTVIGFDTETPCDVVPPQQLDIREPAIPGSWSQFETNCNNAGGTPESDPVFGENVCVSVDF